MPVSDDPLSIASRRGSRKLQIPRFVAAFANDFYVDEAMVRDAVQRRDVRNLIGAADTLDWTYLRRWASHLTVADLLDEVSRG